MSWNRFSIVGWFWVSGRERQTKAAAKAKPAINPNGRSQWTVVCWVKKVEVLVQATNTSFVELRRSPFKVELSSHCRSRYHKYQGIQILWRGSQKEYKEIHLNSMVGVEKLSLVLCWWLFAVLHKLCLFSYVYPVQTCCIVLWDTICDSSSSKGCTQWISLPN